MYKEKKSMTVKKSIKRFHFHLRLVAFSIKTKILHTDHQKQEHITSPVDTARRACY